MHRALINEMRKRYFPGRLCPLWQAALEESSVERFTREIVLRWEEAAEILLESLEARQSGWDPRLKPPVTLDLGKRRQRRRQEAGGGEDEEVEPRLLELTGDSTAAPGGDPAPAGGEREEATSQRRRREALPISGAGMGVEEDLSGGEAPTAGSRARSGRALRLAGPRSAPGRRDRGKLLVVERPGALEKAGLGKEGRTTGNPLAAAASGERPGGKVKKPAPSDGMPAVAAGPRSDAPRGEHSSIEDPVERLPFPEAAMGPARRGRLAAHSALDNVGSSSSNQRETMPTLFSGDDRAEVERAGWQDGLDPWTLHALLEERKRREEALLEWRQTEF